MRKFLTKAVPVSAAAVVALGLAGTAHAATFKVGGQIDRAFTYANNGKQSSWASVDNDGTDSRFNFSGTQDMGDNLKVGFLYEIAVRQAPSSHWDINNNTDFTGSGGVQIDTRHIEAYLQSDFGTVTLGKGFGPAEYTDTKDLSGTTFLGGGGEYTDYSDLSYVDSAGNHKFTVGNTQSNFHALGRTNRVRYDTPSINGFVGSASIDSGDAYELGLNYKLKLAGGVKFVLGAGWADSERHGVTQDVGTGATSPYGTSRFRVFNGSASLLLGNGLVFTIAGAHQKTVSVTGAGTSAQAGYDATYLFGQLGYVIGKNHIAVNYGETSDYKYQGIKGSQIGAAYVYSWTKAVTLYASYHRYMLSLPGYVKTAYSLGSQKPINQIFAGVRFKFL